MTVDVLEVMKQYMLTVAGITNVTGTRIYKNDLPGKDGNKPADGACVVISFRSAPVDYAGKVMSAQIQLRCYHPDKNKALQVGLAVHGNLEDTMYTGIKYCKIMQYPVVLPDPSNGWYSALVWANVFFDL